MLKKFVFYSLLFVCFWNVGFLKAEEYGNVYLDLKEYSEEKAETGNGFILKFWEMTKNYIEDVKEYDDLLVDKTINKDFSEDLKNKYKNFNDVKSKEWEGYVRNGVKAYRIYKNVKEKAINWITNIELPLVVGDDQYEMGESEEYIKSDNPVVIKDFKKVVAYSGKEKDVLSAEEKYAKDHNLELPSQKMEKYRKLIIEKKWKELFNLYFSEIKNEVYKTPEMKVDAEKNKVKAIILSKHQYTDKNGDIQGVILVEAENKNVLLFSGYGKEKQINVSLEKSENIEDIEIKFVSPQQIEDKNGVNMLVYASKFPIYFRGKVKDKTKDVLIKASLSASVCLKNVCERVLLEPGLKLKTSEKVEDTLYSSYVVSTLMNVPDDFYKDKYKFGNLVWEKKDDGSLGTLRIDVETPDDAGFDMFIIGNEAKYFARQRISLNEKNVVVRFDLKDSTFNPLGKEISFWVSTNRTKNYIHKQVVKEMSAFDVEGATMSWGVLWFAFVGGLLLNLMPCVFPVLFLKLFNYVKLDKLDIVKIRKNFVLNVAGIWTSFAVIAFILSVIKWFGRAIGWGMQFQNIYFLVVILWIVIFFFYYICGFFEIEVTKVDNKIKKFEKSSVFEFFNGVFLVLLSTPCMAPYLGTAFGIALAGNIKTIILTVMFVGLGLSTPYILVALFPKTALYFPKPGKWMQRINSLMILLLLITIGWLLSIVVAQTSMSQIWHWIGYLVIMAFILYFWNVLKIEINKIKDKKERIIVYKKIKVLLIAIVSCVIGLSVIDVGYAAKNRQKYVEENYKTKLDFVFIDGLVKNDNQILLKVGADWCLTCKYNDFTTFSVEHVKNEFENNGVFVVDIDWTRYQPHVLKFMQKFGRSGLPFYVLFSKKYPDGIVLPEIISYNDLMRLISK